MGKTFRFNDDFNGSRKDKRRIKWNNKQFRNKRKLKNFNTDIPQKEDNNNGEQNYCEDDNRV